MTIAQASRALETSELSRASGRCWLATILVVGLAVVLRLVLPTNHDVSWLVDAAGRMLSGERLYVDVMEVNPPASIWLYAVPVAVARFLGLPPEAVSDGFVFLAWAAASALAGRILLRANALSTALALPMLVASSAVLLVLPGFVFGEREHIAVLALLPGLASLTARCNGGPPRRLDALMAGVGLGLAAIIKPMFVLGLAGPAGLLLVSRGPRALLATMELWVAAALAGAYGAGVIIFLPAFASRMLPIALAVYVPVRMPWVDLICTAPNALWAAQLLLLYLCSRNGRVGLFPWVLGSASAGFEIVYLQQGKGFPYHLYPAVSLAMLALVVGLLQARAHQRNNGVAANARHFPFAMAAVMVGVTGLAQYVAFTKQLFDAFNYAPGAAAAIRALGPRPRVLTISQHFDLGQPFIREIGGIWAGAAPCAWVTSYVDYLTLQGEPAGELRHFVDDEKARYAADINRKPDAVLVDGERWQAWIDSSPELRTAMTGYHPQGSTYGPVTMWVRNSPASPSAP